MSGRLSGTDQSHSPDEFGMRNGQRPTAAGAAEGQPSELSDRMVRIRKRNCKWIAENRRGVLEAHAMPGFIAP